MTEVALVQKKAYDAWFSMVKDRYPKHNFRLNIKDHPIYIQKLESLNKDHFGYDAFD